MRRSSMLAQQTAGVYVAQGRGSQLHAARARCDWRRRSASRRPARASSSASTSSPSMCTRRRRSTVLEPRRACQCCCLPDGCCEPTVCGRACNASTVAVVRCAGFPPESIFHAREIEDRIQACCPYVHASFTCLHVLTCTYTRVADYGHFCMVRAVSIFDPGHSGEAVDMHAGAGVPHIARPSASRRLLTARFVSCTLFSRHAGRVGLACAGGSRAAAARRRAARCQ